MEDYICVLIKDENGEQLFYQFENEEELRYYLSIHKEKKVVCMQKH